MKRGLLILFTFYFFFVSTGIVWGTHYCGKKISHSIWGISILDSNACKCKHKKDTKLKKECCKHETKWIKADTDDSKIQICSIHSKKSESNSFLYPLVVLNNFFKLQTSTTVYKVSHSPPIIGIPLFIQNCVFLI